GTGTVIADTLGRGLFRIDNVSTFMHSKGTLLIKGDNTDNTMELTGDPNPALIGVNDGVNPPTTVPRAEFDDVRILGLGGTDLIVLDSNGNATSGGNTAFINFPVVVDAGNDVNDQLNIIDSDGVTVDRATITA